MLQCPDPFSQRDCRGIAYSTANTAHNSLMSDTFCDQCSIVGTFSHSSFMWHWR